jgi:hypothetical protein
MRGDREGDMRCSPHAADECNKTKMYVSCSSCIVFFFFLLLFVSVGKTLPSHISDKGDSVTDSGHYKITNKQTNKVSDSHREQHNNCSYCC